MSASPKDVAAPSQKRPLEDPSSPTALSDQPEAKRLALNKKEESPAPVNDDAAAAATSPTENGGDPKTEAVSHEANGEAAAGAPVAVEAAEPAYTQAQTASEVPPPMQTAPVHPGDESQWLHLRSIISSAEAATIIGKGGENVSLIRRLSGAKCTVSDYSRGAVERVLTVSGLVDAVAKAFGLITRTLNNEPMEEASTPQSKTYPLRLLIPHILIGSIIGKQGVRIREIQEASGARLNASDQCLPLSTERSLVILGVADAVHIAAYYVGSTLVEQLTDRFNGPAASAYATRSGGAAGVVPGGMQVVPYVPQSVGGQWGPPDHFRRQGPPGGPGPGYGPPQTPMHGHQQGGYGGAGSPRAGAYGGGQPQGHYGQPAHPQHAGGPPQPAGGMPGQPLTQQIYIPNDMVGAIIGKGGAKINEIRQLSGSVIKINEPQDNSNERLVTITGTQECNQMALYMLYQRLGQVQAGQK